MTDRTANPVERVVGRPLSMQVTDVLRERISSGHRQRGDCLPPFDKLMIELGVIESSDGEVIYFAGVICRADILQLQMDLAL